MKTTEYCLLAANELDATGDSDYAKTVKVLELIAEAYSEWGIDSEQSDALDRVHEAVNRPKRPEAPYCAPLPKESPYYKLSDRLGDILLGEKIPLDISTKEKMLIIPANEVIHHGMLISLAAYLIHDEGDIDIDPSPIRSKILQMYQESI